MTRLLDRLQAKGLVARTADPTDRRALNIDLTDAGLAIWQDINKCGERVRELAMAGMSDEERSVLTGLRERARDHPNSTEPSPMPMPSPSPRRGRPFVFPSFADALPLAGCATPGGPDPRTP